MSADRANRPTLPRVDPHAGKRWSERTDVEECDAITLWSAWTHAVPVTLPPAWNHPGLEARYHRGAEVVLCRSGDELKTVYDLTGPDSNPHVRESVEQQLDITIPTTESNEKP